MTSSSHPSTIAASHRMLAQLSVAAILAAGAGAALAAGPWSPTHVLQGTFAASSPPETPLVAINALGDAVYVWNANGVARTADHAATGTWTPAKALPGGNTAAGPVAVAIGRGGLAAAAWTTVATRYEPSRLLVSLRPAGGVFMSAVEISPGTVAGAIKLGIDCAGSVTVLWSTSAGLSSSTLPGASVPKGECNGTPGTGPWGPAAQISNAGVGAGLPDLVVNDAGAALAVWQEGAPGNPSSIAAAYRPAGGAWQAPSTISAPTARATWNPKPGLDALGGATVGYLDGSSMVVVTRPASGPWQTPAIISDAQQVQYPALAVTDAGDVIAAWLSTDATSGTAVWQRQWHAGAWGPATRLSGRNDTPDWPSAAASGDGSLAIVTWTDDTAQRARASVLQAGAWKRQTLGPAYWGGTVSVAAGGGKAAAGWARAVRGNPNAAQLVGRATP